MPRIPQPPGARGSLKWIQRAVNRPQLLNQAIRTRLNLPGADEIEWCSPLEADAYAEYGDEAALERLQIPVLREPLQRFWPKRGPQWDALARCRDRVILVEAKAHIPEVVSSPSKAQGHSRTRIRGRLNDVKRSLGAKAPADWSGTFYQYANRLAYLHWLRSHHVPAFLVSVYFTNAPDVPQPVTSAAEWNGALTVIRTYLGLGRQHPLKPFVIDVFVDVDEIRRSR